MLHTIQKELTQEGVLTTVVELQRLPDILQYYSLGYRLPLVVLPLAKPSIHEVMADVRSTWAEWLLFLPEPRPIDDIFLQIYIPLDCEFLVAVPGNEGIIYLKEVYRIKKHFPLVIQTIGNWSLQMGLAWRTTGFYNRRKNLHGLGLRVVVSEFDLPTTLIRDDSGATVKISGFLGETWSELEKRLNFTSKYIETTEEDWSIKSDFGTWFGMIGVLARKEADAAIGGLTMYSSRLKVVDFLMPLMIDNTNLYIERIETLELHWSSFLAPFKRNLWLAVTAAIFILTGTLSLFHHLGHSCKRNGSHPGHFLESLYCVYSAFCSQGQEMTPRSWPCRIVYLTSYVLGYVLLAAYSAALVSFLTVQRDILPFTGFEGLLRDGTYKLGVTKGAEVSYFTESKNYVMRTLYRRLIQNKRESLHDNAMEGILRLCAEDKYALVTSDMWLMRIENGDVPCNIQKVPHTTIPGSVSMALSKRSPYKCLFNHNLRQMWLSGVLHRLRQRYWRENMPKINRQTFGITFTAVAPIFTILAIGITTACSFVVLEFGFFMMCNVEIFFSKKRKLTNIKFH